MSLRMEQYWSLQQTREFLVDLLDPKKTPRVPKDVRQRARRCLKHFPFLDEDGRPRFSTDEFSPPFPNEENIGRKRD